MENYIAFPIKLMTLAAAGSFIFGFVALIVMAPCSMAWDAYKAWRGRRQT